MKFANGYDATYRFNLDPLGILYIGIAAAWTVILVIGIIFVVANRRLPFLRIRNIPLAVSAVATLHVYWVLCFLAYTLQAYFPCKTEYWIMSIYLPLGIALFHASNTQLLHIAGLQKKFANVHGLPEIKHSGVETNSRRRRNLFLLGTENKVKKTMAYIAYGMILQFVVTTFIYLASRKFHPSFGLDKDALAPGAPPAIDWVCYLYHAEHGTMDCDAAHRIQCRRGWEWIPSIVWQLLWAWIYAPYLLWKLRGIKDNYGWRKQTVFCCLAGMLGSPMWLSALYVPGMSVVDEYFVPPLWFALPIFLIEAFLIFVPCYQILKNRRLRSETLNIIAEWEHKNSGTSLATGSTTIINSRTSLRPSSLNTASSKRSELFTMAALNSCLRANPQPLLTFAALKDFSGENIAFLTTILEWKRSWSPSSPSKSGFLRRPNQHDIDNKTIQRQQFKKAVDIYASFVSLKYSEFPINISSSHLKELEAVFEGAALNIFGNLPSTYDAATPFERLLQPKTSTTPTRLLADIESCANSTGDKSAIKVSVTECGIDDVLSITDTCQQGSLSPSYELTSASDSLPDYVPIPMAFGPEVFDHAEESIKYTVLTNTWPKFVNAGYARHQKKSFFELVHRQFILRRDS